MMYDLPPCPITKEEWEEIHRQGNELARKLQSSEKALEIMLTWPKYIAYVHWKGEYEGLRELNEREISEREEENKNSQDF